MAPVHQKRQGVMGGAKYLLAVVSIFLLGTAAGSFAHHPRDGSGYAVPIALALCGIVAAIAAWKSDQLVRRFSKKRERGSDTHDL
jgi:hypothetical protein